MSLETRDYSEEPAPRKKLVLVPGIFGVFGAKVIVEEVRPIKASSEKPTSESDTQIQNSQNLTLLDRVTHAIIPEGFSVFGQNLETTIPDNSKDNPQQ